MANTPGMSEKLSSTIFCVTSDAEQIPNGIRLNLYLPIIKSLYFAGSAVVLVDILIATGVHKGFVLCW